MNDKKLAQGERRTVSVRAPQRLGISNEDLPGTVAFLAAIRTAVCDEDLDALVDLRDCETISAGACLMLCAELDLCQNYRSGSIDGYDPRADRPQKLLKRFGFHQHLGFGRGKPVNSRIIRITSGLGVSESDSRRLMHISELATGVFGAPFAEEVHQALAEAFTNVTGHAYVGADEDSCMYGRWWFAGVLNGNEARFYAFDHGVGIQARAPEKMGSAIKEYWAGGNHLSPPPLSKPMPADILEAAMRARRLGIDTGHEGRGFPEMVGLIEGNPVNGRLHVVSRDAWYRFVKLEGGELQEEIGGTRQPAPGTLLAWTISKPLL